MDKMADDQIVVCDVLCFLLNKYGKIASKTLKTTICDFYTVDCLAAAKIQLIKDLFIYLEIHSFICSTK